MLLVEVEKRLQAEVAGKFKIDHALNMLGAFSKKSQSAVTMYLLPLGEIPRDMNRTSGPSLDDVVVHFSVVYAIRNLSGKEEFTQATLNGWRDQVRLALNGWTPPLPKYTPMRRGKSDLVTLVGHTMWWQDEFKTKYLEEGLANG